MGLYQGSNQIGTLTIASVCFGWGDDIVFDLEVVDIQDGSSSNGGIDCDDVNVVPSTAHLNHLHDQQTINQCQGLITLVTDYQISINSGGPEVTTSGHTLEVEFVTAETIVINIYDSVGKGFYFGEVSFEAGSNIMNLDINHLTDGLYYIKLNSRATNISGRKLLITN